MFQDVINEINVFDLDNTKTVKTSGKINYCQKWEDVYNDSDILITCTVSTFRYIDIKPKSGSLHLNISLRDYKENMYEYFKETIIVDDWDEVCRKNTDIEMFSIKNGLKKSSTFSILEIVCEEKLKSFDDTKPIFFNPMGMAVFDIAMANYYYFLSIEMEKGLILE